MKLKNLIIPSRASYAPFVIILFVIMALPNLSHVIQLNPFFLIVVKFTQEFNLNSNHIGAYLGFILFNTFIVFFKEKIPISLNRYYIIGKLGDVILQMVYFVVSIVALTILVNFTEVNGIGAFIYGFGYPYTLTKEFHDKAN